MGGVDQYSTRVETLRFFEKTDWTHAVVLLASLVLTRLFTDVHVKRTIAVPTLQLAKGLGRNRSNAVRSETNCTVRVF